MGCTATDSDTIEFVPPVDSFYVALCPFPDTICPLECPMVSFLGWSFVDSSGSSTSLPAAAGNCVNVTQEGTYRLFAIYETNCTVIHDYLVTNACSSGLCSVNLGPDILAISNCQGPNLESTVTGTPGYTYAWTGSSAVSFYAPNSAQTTVTATGAGMQTIVLTITDTTGCMATDSMNILFYSPVDTFYTYTCGFPSDSLCKLNIPIPFGTLTWQFWNGSSYTNVGTGNCYAPTVAGTYQAFGIYETNCTVTQKYIVVDSCASAINEYMTQAKIDIYPNPANDFVGITSDSFIKNIRVLNAAGQTVMNVSLSTMSTKSSLNLANLMEGYYVINIVTEKGIANRKLIKSK
jgi:hypothetical protein